MQTLTCTNGGTCAFLEPRDGITTVHYRVRVASHTCSLHKINPTYFSICVCVCVCVFAVRALDGHHFG